MDLHWVVQQAGQAPHDGKAETKTLSPVAFGGPNLDELGKNIFEMVVRDADAGIDNGDLDGVARTPTPDRDGSGLRIPDGILHKIPDDASQQAGIGLHSAINGSHTPVQSLGF